MAVGIPRGLRIGILVCCLWMFGRLQRVRGCMRKFLFSTQYYCVVGFFGLIDFISKCRLQNDDRRWHRRAWYEPPRRHLEIMNFMLMTDNLQLRRAERERAARRGRVETRVV